MKIDNKVSDQSQTSTITSMKEQRVFFQNDKFIKI